MTSLDLHGLLSDQPPQICIYTACGLLSDSYIVRVSYKIFGVGGKKFVGHCHSVMHEHAAHVNKDTSVPFIHGTRTTTEGNGLRSETKPHVISIVEKVVRMYESFETTITQTDLR